MVPALLIVLALCGSVSGRGINTTPGPKVFGCNACYNAKFTYIGTPFSTPIATKEVDCFSTCAAATNSQHYQWNQLNKRCTCFLSADVTGCVADNAELAGTEGFNVSGKVQSCFPFCSIGVKTCNTCRRSGIRNINCVKNYSVRRCCCTPPSRIRVRWGAITGCANAPTKMHAVSTVIDYPPFFPDNLKY